MQNSVRSMRTPTIEEFTKFLQFSYEIRYFISIICPILVDLRKPHENRRRRCRDENGTVKVFLNLTKRPPFGRSMIRC